MTLSLKSQGKRVLYRVIFQSAHVVTELIQDQFKFKDLTAMPSTNCSSPPGTSNFLGRRDTMCIIQE